MEDSEEAPCLLMKNYTPTNKQLRNLRKPEIMSEKSPISSGLNYLIKWKELLTENFQVLVHPYLFGKMLFLS
jgi:hypothetical protein